VHARSPGRSCRAPAPERASSTPTRPATQRTQRPRRRSSRSRSQPRPRSPLQPSPEPRSLRAPFTYDTVTAGAGAAAQSKTFTLTNTGGESIDPRAPTLTGNDQGRPLPVPGHASAVRTEPRDDRPPGATHPRSRPLDRGRDDHAPRAPWHEQHPDRRTLARSPGHRLRTHADPRPNPSTSSLDDSQVRRSHRPPH
jgi:hypothetical protein